jgi:hypothetical protein
MAEQPEDKIITFEQYYDPMLAHIIRTKLEDNGVPCFIADDNIISANPIYSNAVGGIKLKIFERDLERCREIVATCMNKTILKLTRKPTLLLFVPIAHQLMCVTALPPKEEHIGSPLYFLCCYRHFRFMPANPGIALIAGGILIKSSKPH